MVLMTATGGAIGSYARPVVNVTVPITTLLGVEDQPGILSGGTAVPADLAARIALDPNATWYRMLTDNAGHFLELSTRSYKPTAPIKNTVDARDQSCVYPSCNRPAVDCAFDHRIPYPEGETSTANGQPLCARHHQIKHARGFHVVRNNDGSYTWTTRFGSTFTTPAVEQPITTRPTNSTPTTPPRHTTPPKRDHDVDDAFDQLVSPLEREFARLLIRTA
jgi:hypothetical protein